MMKHLFWNRGLRKFAAHWQIISDNWMEEWGPKIRKKISQNTENVNSVICTREVAENGWQYLKVHIYPTNSTLACTSKGVYTIRFEDETHKLKPTELGHILNEKGAYIWESRKTRFLFSDCDDNSFAKLLWMIKANERLDDFIKAKTDRELCEYYKLIEDGYLTNLGVLWIGTMAMRSKISYPLRLSILYLDDSGTPMRPQKDYTDLTHSPQAILEAVMELEIWREGIEISDGIYREFVEFYPREAVKELVANAICHRSYTLDGDIFIKIYANSRLEIISPWSLPLGVTPNNILTTSKPRNQQLAELAKATKMMEKLGSGYDKVYEQLLSKWKNVPRVESWDDFVKVTITRTLSDPGVVNLMQDISKQYTLSQKEVIMAGLIAQNKWLTSLEISTLIWLDTKTIHEWIWTLPNKNIITQKGNTRGTIYMINPKLLRQLNHKIKTSLKSISTARLRALVKEDLTEYPDSTMGEVQSRIWKEIPQRKIRLCLNAFIEEWVVERSASKGRYVRYWMVH